MPVRPPTHTAVIFERYTTRLQSKGTTPHTILNYRRMVERFVAHCEAEGIDPERITEDELQAYFNAMPFALNTKRHHRAHLGGAYRYAHRKGWMTYDPFIDLVLPTRPTHIPRTLDYQDVRLLGRAAPDERAYALWALLTFGGLRAIEVRRLRWEDVNLRRMDMLVNGKQDKQRVVPVHPRLGEALERLNYRLGHHVLAGRHGGEMGSPGYTYQFDRLRKSADVRATSHDFRRTWASSLRRNGVDMMTVKVLGGWAPRSVIEQHYLHVNPADMQGAILRAYQDDPV